MMSSKRVACLFACAALMVQPLHAARPVPGAYAIRVCRSACPLSGDADVYVRGTLMLFANALEPAEVGRLDPTFEPDLPNAKPNGCFVLERVSSEAQARHASYKTSGLVHWAMADGGLRFSLYHVVDSGYAVSLDPARDGFEGKGVLWGDFLPTPKPEPDRIDIKWIGAADPALCRPAKASWSPAPRS